MMEDYKVKYGKLKAFVKEGIKHYKKVVAHDRELIEKDNKKTSNTMEDIAESIMRTNKLNYEQGILATFEIIQNFIEMNDEYLEGKS